MLSNLKRNNSSVNQPNEPAVTVKQSVSCKSYFNSMAASTGKHNATFEVTAGGAAQDAGVGAVRAELARRCSSSLRRHSMEFEQDVPLSERRIYPRSMHGLHNDLLTIPVRAEDGEAKHFVSSSSLEILTTTELSVPTGHRRPSLHLRRRTSLGKQHQYQNYDVSPSAVSPMQCSAPFYSPKFAKMYEMRIRRLRLFMKQSDITRKALRTLKVKHREVREVTNHSKNEGVPEAQFSSSTLFNRDNVQMSHARVIDHQPRTIEAPIETASFLVPAETKKSEDDVLLVLQNVMTQLEKEEIRLIATGVEMEASMETTAYPAPAETGPRRFTKNLSEEDMRLQTVMNPLEQESHSDVIEQLEQEWRSEFNKEAHIETTAAYPFSAAQTQFRPARRIVSREPSRCDVFQMKPQFAPSSYLHSAEATFTERHRSLSETEIFQQQFFPDLFA
jgi:hypothetical protein